MRLGAVPIVALTLLMVGCAAPDRMTSVRGALPEGIELPRLNGSATSIGDQLCAWAARQQIRFSPNLGTVYLETASGANDGREIVRGILREFMRSTEGPSELILSLDVASLESVDDSLDVMSHIAGPGLWSFAKRERSECERRLTPDRSLALAQSGQCIEVRRLDTAPNDATIATYHELHVLAPIESGALMQAISIRVLSLKRDDQLIGRSVRARLFADPRDLGRITRVCEPAPLPLRFQSAAEDHL